MKKRKVFIFWIGDRDKISHITNKLKKQGFEVEIGPSTEEDKFLKKEYKYYADSRRLKIHSFASDIWRVYKLANSKGMYIDASVIIGDKFSKLYDRIEKYPVWLPRAYVDVLGFCVMYSNGKDKYFQEILDQFKTYSLESPRLFWLGPHVGDYVSYKMGHFDTPNYELYTIDGVTYDKAESIVDKDTIIKIGFESWKKRKTESTKPGAWWRSNVKNWYTNQPDSTKYDFKRLPSVSFNIWKSSYFSGNKAERKIIKKELIKYFGKKVSWNIFGLNILRVISFIWLINIFKKS